MSKMRIIRDARGNPIGRVHKDDDDCSTVQDNQGNTEYRIVRRGGQRVVVDRQGNVIEYLD